MIHQRFSLNVPGRSLQAVAASVFALLLLLLLLLQSFPQAGHRLAIASHSMNAEPIPMVR
jgi:hypothetical protein